MGPAVWTGRLCELGLGQGHLGFEVVTVRCLLCLLGSGGRWLWVLMECELVLCVVEM